MFIEPGISIDHGPVIRDPYLWWGGYATGIGYLFMPPINIIHLLAFGKPVQFRAFWIYIMKKWLRVGVGVLNK